MDFLLNLFQDDETHKKVLTSVAIFLLTTVASFLIGRWYGKWKARREWGKKHFLGRILVSLNNFKEKRNCGGSYIPLLKIRTIFERGLEEIFTTPVAVEKIQEASKKTTVENPMLPMAKEDRWYLLNFVLNAIAEKFTDGLIEYDSDIVPVTPVKYLICLTCEVVGDDKIRKVRVMMIRKEELLNLPDVVDYTREWHNVRMNTLRKCAKIYKEEPDNFLEVEVYV